MRSHSPQLNAMSFRLLDDDEFDRLSDKQRVEYLACAIDALEKLRLQIHRQLSSDVDDQQVEQSAPPGPQAPKVRRAPL